MVDTYFIHFTFRAQEVKAYVEVYEGFCFVNITNEAILQDFTSRFQFELPLKRFTPGHINNPDAKDITDLIRGIAAQLR